MRSQNLQKVPQLPALTPEPPEGQSADPPLDIILQDVLQQDPAVEQLSNIASCNAAILVQIVKLSVQQ